MVLELRDVEARLSPEDYDRAVRAHRRGLDVNLRGDVVLPDFPGKSPSQVPVEAVLEGKSIADLANLPVCCEQLLVTANVLENQLNMEE